MAVSRKVEQEIWEQLLPLDDTSVSLHLDGDAAQNEK